MPCRINRSSQQPVLASFPSRRVAGARLLPKDHCSTQLAQRLADEFIAAAVALIRKQDGQQAAKHVQSRIGGGRTPVRVYLPTDNCCWGFAVPLGICISAVAAHHAMTVAHEVSGSWPPNECAFLLPALVRFSQPSEAQVAHQVLRHYEEMNGDWKRSEHEHLALSMLQELEAEQVATVLLARCAGAGRVAGNFTIFPLYLGSFFMYMVARCKQKSVGYGTI